MPAPADRHTDHVPRPRRRRRGILASAASVAVLAAGVAACDDDGDDAPLPASTVTTLVAPGGGTPLEPGTNLSTPATSSDVPGNTSEELVDVTSGSGGTGEGGG
jgi:hypothetical protein